MTKQIFLLNTGRKLESNIMGKGPKSLGFRQETPRIGDWNLPPVGIKTWNRSRMGFWRRV